MYGDVGLFTDMYGYLRLMKGYVGLCLAMYRLCKACGAMWGYVWLCRVM